MPGGVEVLRGMLVLRVVATADMTADQTNPQVEPGVADFQAVLAAIRAGWTILDQIFMAAPGCPAHKPGFYILHRHA